MKFGGFYEHQLPRPWAPGAEHKLSRASKIPHHLLCPSIELFTQDVLPEFKERDQKSARRRSSPAIERECHVSNR